MIFDHSRSLFQHNALGVRLYFASHGLNLYSVLASVSSMFLVSSWWVSPLVKLLQTCYFFFCLFADRDKFLLFLHLPHSVPPPSQFHYISRFLPSPPTHRHKPARQPSMCTDSLLRWAWGNTSLDMDTVILRGTCRFFMSWICSNEEPTEHICLAVF